GLALAATSLLRGSPGQSGTESHLFECWVSDYIEEVVLAPAAPGDLRFVEEMSVLDTLTGADCDAIADTDGSAQRLRVLERNLPGFLIDLDGRRHSFRFSAPLRDHLRRNLSLSPERLNPLHRKAGEWFARQTDIGSACRHLLAAGENEHAA